MISSRILFVISLSGVATGFSALRADEAWARPASNSTPLRADEQARAGIIAGSSPSHSRENLRANFIITVADDFVVDVYDNGKVVPDTQRHLLSEMFGATREQIDLQVFRGDWIVFHVVNDRLRWGGAYYFVAAGLFDRNEIGFVSSLSSGDWSACDAPAQAYRFIAERDFMKDNPAREIVRPWADGLGLIKQAAGDNWAGDPIWGSSEDRDVWLKIIVR
ncbi:MAG TPA: hypothetical protein VL981_01025 [Candidatus Methylacidiphilales bacterium]|nr:hypothetical protein [Candidatus Methylacidiphilales bacterium]